MTVRRPRTAVAAALGALALLAAGGVAVAVPGSPAPSPAAQDRAAEARAPAAGTGQPGYCPDRNGVTVVVDFNELGGGIVVRCAPGPIGSGFTGLDALQGAGFQPEGTKRWGLQFVCRIAGKPAPDQRLHINGDPNYREACVNTPPAAAFWSYWYAPNGGSWTLSSTGPASRDVIPGGFEGWSFSLNHSQDTAPAPGIPPRRPHRPPPTTPPPTSPPSTTPHTSPPTTHQPPTHSPVTSAPTPTSLPTRTSVAPTGRVRPGNKRGRRGGAAYGSTLSSSPSPSATNDPLAVGHNAAGEKVSGALPGTAGSSSGSPRTAAIGLVVVAALAAGCFVAWRRRPGRR